MTHTIMPILHTWLMIAIVWFAVWFAVEGLQSLTRKWRTRKKMPK